MKTPNYLIQIAEPCHEDWNAMVPEAKGKFCHSCSKTVIDFSGKTDLEIHTILMEKQSEKVCGHFKKSQVNRALNLRIDFNNLPENMSTTKRFALVLLMTFGTMLFNFTDLKGQQIQNVQVEETETVTYMKGKIAPRLVKEEVPEPPDTLVSVEPMMMGAIAYPMPDTAVRRMEEPEILMGDVEFVPNENCQEPKIAEEDLAKKIVGEQTDFDLIQEPEAEFIIYPNPSHADFSIRYEVLKRTDVNIQLLDNKGMLVENLVDIKQQHVGKYEIPVNTNDLADGVYIINYVMDKKRVSKKIIIEK